MDSVFKGGNITELERYDETGGAEREAKRVRDMTNAARFFSPTQTNLDERRMVGELAGNMDTNRNFARGQFNVDQQIIDSIRPDEGMMMLAGILKGAGTATGFYGAGANIAAEQATKKAIEEAAVKTAIESTIPSTAARWSLGEGAKGIVSSAGSNVLAPTASGIGSSATMFGVPPGAQDIGRQMMLPTTDSTARMFGAGNNTIAPFNAANSGVQNRSYQLWNLPYR